MIHWINKNVSLSSFIILILIIGLAVSVTYNKNQYDSLVKANYEINTLTIKNDKLVTMIGVYDEIAGESIETSIETTKTTCKIVEAIKVVKGKPIKNEEIIIYDIDSSLPDEFDRLLYDSYKRISP